MRTSPSERVMVPQSVCITFCCNNTGIEDDRLTQSEVLDVVLEVLEEFGVVREVGRSAETREVLECQAPLRRVDMQALVAGRHPVGILVVPVSADLVDAS